MSNATAWVDHSESFGNGLKSLFVGSPDTTEEDLSQLVLPTYTQEVDGRKLMYAEFVSHIRHLRQKTKHIDIKVHQFLRQGNQVADRHIATASFEDGSSAKFEILLFGQISDDNRLAWVVETSRQVTGSGDHKKLGGALETD